MQTLHITLKDAPEVRALILAADPGYKKHKALLYVAESVTLNGTYWDGGSRYSYTAVSLLDRRIARDAPQFNPPQFGGPREAPTVALPENTAVVKTGIFAGKTATAMVYIRPDNAAKLLPQPATL